MMTAVYRIADKNISIDSLYGRVHDYCRDYLTEEPAELSVRITEEDIEYERSRSERTAELEGRAPHKVSDEYLEELAVYRKISELMPYHGTFLFHGSCIAVEGEGYLFTAVSGTGKSTHAALWRQLLGDKTVMVNDDKPLIKVTDRGAVIYGTPYNGKHRLGSNISVPLKAIALLERSEENSIEAVTAGELYPRLIQQMYRPADPAALALSMSLIDRLLLQVKLYRLKVNMDISAAETAYNAMKG
ncbi:MAG: hypothetical protein IKP95_08810 [Ruminococcus sp.]|nr:hypothetical protein [Ruminococcus sp.]